MTKMTAEVSNVEEIVMIPTRMVEKRYTLNMSQEEVQIILDILMHVGGDPLRSRRKHATSILSALYNVDGLNRHHSLVKDFVLERGSIIFNNV